MEKRRLWQRPRLRTDEEQGLERKATWLELFYDLVFVVVIAELAHTLSKDINPAGIATFGFLFIPVWWVWIGVTFYDERFETGDISHRLLMFLQMIPVAAMSLFAHDALGEGSQGFALAYAGARTLLIMLLLRAGWYVKPYRPISNRSAIGSCISIALFILSVFFPPPLRFVLWGIGLFIDLLHPLLTMQYFATLPRFSSTRLPERFGLFTIIVLGESIAGAISGVARNPEASGVGITALLGLALAFGIWWVYFDFVARRAPIPRVLSTVVWVYLHLPLVIAIAAIGAAVLAIVGSQGGPLHGELRWLITGAVSMALVAMGLLETVLQRGTDEPTHPVFSPLLKIAGGTLALVVGTVGGDLTQWTVLSFLLAIIVVQMAYGSYAWIISLRSSEGPD